MMTEIYGRFPPDDGAVKIGAARPFISRRALQNAASLKLIIESLPDLIANHSDPACGRMRSR